MPRIVFHNPTGEFVVLEKGEIRPLREDEIPKVNMDRIANRMGIEGKLRLFGKNLSNTREDFRNLLRASGYLVSDIKRPVGKPAVGKVQKFEDVGGFQFAVQKLHWDGNAGGGSGGFSEPDLINGWNLVEPSTNPIAFAKDIMRLMADTYSGGSFSYNRFLASERGQELLMDFGDVVSFPLMAAAELGVGAAVTTVTKSPSLGMAAMSVTASGAEAFRQYLGRKLGIPQPYDPFMVTFAGAAAGFNPLPGATTRAVVQTTQKVTKGLGAGGRTLQARIGGVKGQDYFPGREMIAVRADTMPQLLDSPFEAAGKIYAMLKQAGKVGLEEGEFIENFIIRAGRQKTRINLSRAFGALEDIDPIKEISDPASRARVQRSLEKIAEILGDSKETEVPIRLAYKIMQEFGTVAADAKVFAGQKLVRKEFEKASGEAWRLSRESIVNKFGGPKTEFGKTLTKFGKKIEVLENIKGFLGPQEMKAGKVPRFEAVIKGTFNRRVLVDEFKKFDELFEQDTLDLLRKTVTGQQFIQEGAPTIPGFLPKLTTQGVFMGVSLVGGATAGYFSDIPGGKYIGLGLGAFAGSPRGQMFLTKAGRGKGLFGAPTRFARGVGKAISPERVIPASIRDVVDPRLMFPAAGLQAGARSLAGMRDPRKTGMFEAEGKTGKRVRNNRLISELQRIEQERLIGRNTEGSRVRR